MVEIRDELGRSFKTLRISLLNTCNLACVYCSCGNEDSKQNHLLAKDKSLSAWELLALVKRLHEQLNLSTVRFTGGEPLLYKNLATFVEGVHDLGINDLKLTTNALLLERLSPSLKAAGLKSINVSLDAIDPLVFFQMSRRHDLTRTLRGIDSALQQGIEVKINSVIMKGLNDNQIIPLLNFAFERGLTIRFLEIMAMGHLFGNSDKHFFSQEDMLQLIGTHHSFMPLLRTTSSTANYWQTTNGNRFGIVANESQPFCLDCNRLRLDTFGNIYGCLSSNHPVPIKEALNPLELEGKIKEALAQKQALKFTGSTLSMLHIGG
ncbi:GTP 3',8-cyclase MoaA [Arcticibacter eurypsychrophilus]|uniref:GTP 3',8-cyclase MoaA n=1 Tax=Arcticibacter eurypsychrophilus TaxID=1434752 RepID=UPI00084CF859|nr:GTP 3',8-cyclase MoaA [Arcticibacter eurypsychrophilus]